jgi:class 3 adenylate cyclase/tetratricopeptide (TPR) repeat protein
MLCPSCQTANREGAEFCRECGTHIEILCAACGSSLQSGSRFCGACGAARPSPSLPVVSSRFGSPNNYTPKHLVDKILRSRSALEGERKQVTILFVDVLGFTSLAEQHDPEEIHEFMTRAFELMLIEVHRYEGTVNQFLGDGIMALFGAPVAHEDHPQRAVRAALGIRKVMQEYVEELRRRRGITFQIRQGLNSGLVVVGGIGSDLRMDYTAVGDTTNVAARLQQAAQPERIVISESTHRLVDGYFFTRPLGAVPVKGKTEPVVAWEVISARTERTRFEVEAERGLTPFVGRERELNLLTQCFEKAKAGHGQVVLVVGDAGIGKSRLAFEFRRRLGDEVTWLEGHCMSFGRAAAFHPLIDLLKRNFRVEEGDAEPTIVEKIERNVLRLGEDLRPTLPFLRYLLSVDPGDQAVLTMDPKQRRQAIFDALRRLLVRAAEVRPQVLIYEDAHWMDKATEEMLAATVGMVASNRIIQILTYRTGYLHPLGERTFQTRIGLDVLSGDDSAEMARAILAAESLPGDLKALIAKKAEGNPFFVEEVVKSLRDLKAVRASGDGYVLTRKLDEIAVPDTIQDVIMARIDRLADNPKRTLQLAAVVGREFSRRLLDRIVEPGESAELALRELQSQELIYERNLFPELAYMFRHALTQEVAYHSLLVHTRKELHQQIGAAIEEMYADRLTEHYEVLAHHFSKGAEPGKALEYFLKAGDKAAQTFANGEARAFYEQALELLGESDPKRAEVLKKLATTTQYLGDADASLAYAEAAVGLYEKLGDKRNAVAMHLHIQVLYGWQWDGAREDQGLKHLEAAAALVEHDPDSVEKGLVFQRTGHMYLHRSDPTATCAWARKAVDMFARLQTSMGTSLGTALAYTGHVDEGIAYSEKNWGPVRKAAVPVALAVMGHELSLVLALVRDVPRAIEWGERVLPEVVKTSPVFEAMVRRPLVWIYALSGDRAKAEETCQAVEAIEAKTLLGCIYEDGAAIGLYYLRRGNWEKARTYLTGALARYEDRNNFAAVSACLMFLGSLHVEAGDFGEAEPLLLRSLDISRRGGNVLVELWALPTLAELYVKTGRTDLAADQVRRGFDLLEPNRGWYGLPAPLWLARGMLASTQGGWDEAARAFEHAISINRQYGLPYDEAKVLREYGRMYAARDGEGDPARAAVKREESAKLFEAVGAQDIERIAARKEV